MSQSKWKFLRHVKSGGFTVNDTAIAILITLVLIFRFQRMIKVENSLTEKCRSGSIREQNFQRKVKCARSFLLLFLFNTEILKCKFTLLKSM